MRTHQGFTLIELMIVVAIIAILAAIATPLYNDYVARAQLSEAVNLAGSLQPPITVAYVEQPNASFCALPTGTVASGKYVASVVAANATDVSCDLIATMRSGIATKASSKTVTFNYSVSPVAGQPNWTCTSDANAEVKPRPCS